MGKPKKRTSDRRSRTGDLHHRKKLADAVNAKSPVKVFTTAKQSGKKLTASIKATTARAKAA
jgi:hypothetical protein